jgi:hypothetical protein
LVDRSDARLLNPPRAPFAALPADVCARLQQVDYTAAERVCPNRPPITQLMHEAAPVPG